MVIGNRLSAASSKVKNLLGFSSTDSPSSAEVPSVLDRTGFDGSLEGAEVIGRSPLSYVAAGESVSPMMGKHIGHKLAEYGLDDIQPDEWYPLRAPLAMLFDMREEYGEGSMQNMGQNLPDHVEFPPGISGVEEALGSIDDAYNHNHRGGAIGFYEFHKNGAGEGRMICENPYPCELDQGLIRGVAQKFADSPVQVEEISERCRADGGQRCKYRIEWVEV